MIKYITYMDDFREKILKKVIDFADEYGMFEKCGHVITGLSGGADSVCLFDILFRISKKYGFSMEAVHVHHGIRGKEADADMNFCRQLCQKYGVSYFEKMYDVPQISKENKEGEEETGRRLRYELFNERAAEHGNARIAVAHHKNDRAETILFNIVRGTGIKGLHGILPVRDRIVRPLLCLTKAEILEYVRVCGLDFCEDCTNDNNDYSRNRLRNLVMPQLEIINSSAVENICALSEKSEELEQFIEETVNEKIRKCLKEEDGGILVTGLEKEKRFIAKNIIISAVFRLCGRLKDITDAHISSVYELVFMEPGALVNIKYGITVRKETDGLYFFNTQEKYFFEKPVEIPSSFSLPDGKFIKFRKVLWDESKKIPNGVYTKCFDYDRIRNTLQIRNRRDGDYLVIDKEGHTKKLNQFFIDEKIPVRLRDRIFLLADGNHIIWVIGYRISEEYKITESTENAFLASLEEEYGES